MLFFCVNYENQMDMEDRFFSEFVECLERCVENGGKNVDDTHS
jgi:hypothetical protein